MELKVIAHTEKRIGRHTIVKTISVAEVPPVPESHGGLIMITATIIMSNSWFGSKIRTTESSTFLPGITIKQLDTK